MPVVTVCTQVYNTAAYLSQCIESVLHQTYSDFEFFIVDNGCTDGSQDILKEYAQRDSRIKLIRFEENKNEIRWIPVIAKEGKGKYVANLDSDDWWELDYLERMLGFLEKNDVDLALTGTWAYFEANHTTQILRSLKTPLLLTLTEFAQSYPSVWTFPSTLWASLMKMDIFRTVDFESILKRKYHYGVDTMCMLKYIERCRNIGIDSSALQHYRIHPQGSSYLYNSRRFDSNIACYNQIASFLKINQALDPMKEEWLKYVHLNSLNNTLSILKKSALSAQKKLEECSSIISHPLTSSVLTVHCKEREQWFTSITEILRKCFAMGERLDISPLKKALQTFSPQCNDILQPQYLTLFAKETALCEVLLQDDFDKLRSLVLDMVSKQQNTKQYDLGRLLQSMTSERSLAHQVDDVRFIRKYKNLYENLCKEDFLSVLDEMTKILLDNAKIYNEEFFLNIYISTAALTEQVPAFLFGKIRMAQMYLRQKRKEECQAVLKELDEMGVEGDELEQIHKNLKNII